MIARIWVLNHQIVLYSSRTDVSIRVVGKAIEKPSYCTGELTQSKEALTVQGKNTESKFTLTELK